MGGGLITSLPQQFLVFNYHSTLKIPPIFHLPPKITFFFLFFFWESFNLWHPLLIIALYYQTKTPISFWCRRRLNPRSLIQPSETLPVELTGTHDYFLILFVRNGCVWYFWFGIVLLLCGCINIEADYVHMLFINLVCKEWVCVWYFWFYVCTIVVWYFKEYRSRLYEINGLKQQIFEKKNAQIINFLEKKKRKKEKKREALLNIEAQTIILFFIFKNNGKIWTWLKHKPWNWLGFQNFWLVLVEISKSWLI